MTGLGAGHEIAKAWLVENTAVEVLRLPSSGNLRMTTRLSALFNTRIPAETARLLDQMAFLRQTVLFVKQLS
jgi:hypothetical protein